MFILSVRATSDQAGITVDGVTKESIPFAHETQLHQQYDRQRELVDSVVAENSSCKAQQICSVRCQLVQSEQQLFLGWLC